MAAAWLRLFIETGGNGNMCHKHSNLVYSTGSGGQPSYVKYFIYPNSAAALAGSGSSMARVYYLAGMASHATTIVKNTICQYSDPTTKQNISWHVPCGIMKNSFYGSNNNVNLYVVSDG